MATIAEATHLRPELRTKTFSGVARIAEGYAIRVVLSVAFQHVGGQCIVATITSQTDHLRDGPHIGATDECSDAAAVTPEAEVPGPLQRGGYQGPWHGLG